MSRQPSTRFLLSTTLVIALALRVGAIAIFGDLSSNANLWEYGEQARCAWQHAGDLCRYYAPNVDSYPSAYMPPLLSYLWLVLFGLFGDGPVARAAWLGGSVAAALGCVALTYFLALKLIPSRWVAFTAALLIATYPTFVFVTATYHQTNWAVFLILAVVAISVRLAEGANPWLYGPLGGVLTGVAALNRSEMLFIGPALIALGGFGRRDWRNISIIGVSAVLAMGLVLSPWIIRNYETFGRIIPTAQSQGYNLWKGYNPYTNGSGNFTETNSGPSAEAAAKIVKSVPKGPYYETRLQDAYLRAFETDVRESSHARLAKLALSKIALLWVFDWTDRDLTGRLIYLIPWLVTNLLALVGLAVAWRWRRCIARGPAYTYAATFLLLSAAYAATSVHARYRMHIEPLIFISAGLGCLGIWFRVRGQACSSPIRQRVAVDRVGLQRADVREV